MQAKLRRAIFFSWSGGAALLAALVAANAPGIEGVVVGRALYDGRIDIPAALALASVRN